MGRQDDKQYDRPPMIFDGILTFRDLGYATIREARALLKDYFRTPEVVIRETVQYPPERNQTSRIHRRIVSK